MHLPIIIAILGVIIVAAFNFYMWQYYRDVHR